MVDGNNPESSAVLHWRTQPVLSPRTTVLSHYLLKCPQDFCSVSMADSANLFSSDDGTTTRSTRILLRPPQCFTGGQNPSYRPGRHYCPVIYSDGLETSSVSQWQRVPINCSIMMVGPHSLFGCRCRFCNVSMAGRANRQILLLRSL